MIMSPAVFFRCSRDPVAFVVENDEDEDAFPTPSSIISLDVKVVCTKIFTVQSINSFREVREEKTN